MQIMNDWVPRISENWHSCDSIVDQSASRLVPFSFWLKRLLNIFDMYIRLKMDKKLTAHGSWLMAHGLSKWFIFIHNLRIPLTNNRVFIVAAACCCFILAHFSIELMISHIQNNKKTKIHSKMRNYSLNLTRNVKRIYDNSSFYTLFNFLTYTF